MQVTAHLRGLHIAPQKVRLITDLVRGLDIGEADAQLAYAAKRAARPIRKLIASAAANAEHNFALRRDNLFVAQILVNQGPTLHRYQPRAFGRAAPIRKRSSHVTVILDERVPMAETPRPAGTTHAIPAPKVLTDRPHVRVPEAEGSAVSRGAASVHGSPTGAPPQRQSRGKRLAGFFRQFLNRRSGER